MAILFITFLLPFIVVAESQSTDATNQTDLQVAMNDMRTRSYNGFVILLKLLNHTPASLGDREITFLMPKDDELSKFAPNADQLETFILAHSIPTALLMTHLLYFPNGTLIPSGLTNRMITITNNGRAGLFMNNAKIVTPNVCLNSQIRCHGLSTAINFDNAGSARETGHRNLIKGKAGSVSSRSIKRKGRS